MRSVFISVCPVHNRASQRENPVQRDTMPLIQPAGSECKSIAGHLAKARGFVSPGARRRMAVLYQRQEERPLSEKVSTIIDSYFSQPAKTTPAARAQTPATAEKNKIREGLADN